MIEIAAHEDCTEEEMKALEDDLNENALKMLSQNLPAWMYDNYVIANGMKPIKVIKSGEVKC